ncbi:MAG: F0F1 ATP synthase subunit gamma, partial [Gaiellaceae bacterium]
ADEKVDRVEIIFNHYESPIVQTVESSVLLPLQSIEEVAGGDEDENGQSALWLYEPDPEEILRRLVTDYVEISIYRAMLESTASEHGARMTAMRNASENASELIEDYTLEMNRQRQAEITAEIMEVVAGAEGLR